MTDFCHVANGRCTAPAGYRVGTSGYAPGDTKTRARCVDCDEPCCTGPLCSRVLARGDGPDELGRRHFTLTWADEGIYRPELHPDGDPVGYRRAQCFFCDPARFEAAL